MPLALLVALSIAAGTALGVHLSPPLASACWMMAAACAAAALAARRRRLRGLPFALGGLALAALSAAHGAGAMAAVAQGPLRRWFADHAARENGPDATRVAHPVRLRGRLTDDAAPEGEGVRLVVAVAELRDEDGWHAVDGVVHLTIGGALGTARQEAWRAGRAVEVDARLRRAARYRNPGVADGELALLRRGTALVGSVKSADLVTLTARGACWDELAAGVRASVRSAMARRVAPWSETSAAIGTAILIGDRARMAPEIEQRLQRAGTYHVVAISGGNIALLATALVVALWCARIRFAGAAWTTAAVLSAHAWVVGGGASVARATVVAVVYLSLRAGDLRTSPLHALAVGVAIILLTAPLHVVDAGFWLTVGASAALVAAAARGPAPRGWWAPVALVVTGSMAVELVLAPVSAFVFERVTVAGLVLNLAAVPAMAVVQATATACAMADALGVDGVAGAAGWAVHLASTVLVESSGFVDRVPWSTWRVPAPSPAVMGGYYALLVTAWWAAFPPIDSAARRRLARGATAMAGMTWLWIAVSPSTWVVSGDGRLHVTLLDVGQGDAILVTAPDGTTVLVDAGGLAGASAFDVGARVVVPALLARGVRRLDYLAITHGDADHAGGAGAVLGDFGAREVWVGVPVQSDARERRLRAEAAAARTAWRWLRRGDRAAFGALEIVAHNPPEPDWERQRVRNDDSLVLELRIGAVSVLLTGDVTRTVEDTLSAPLDSRRVTVLKAPHHGSATSSSPDFVAHLAPVAALVSAGRDNPFGHPAPIVLDRYRAAGAEVFRTDRDGQIELVTDGRAVEIRTFTGRRWRLR
ncbi:MAG: DNA internalization-related competence protein ComEC/Rec2 [Vicinamibacterales bacterium]